jgi:16S rRNA (uracil1498-N3)-methyltransferase
MTRVFSDNVPEVGSVVALDAGERHYVVHVKRHAVGDVVEIVGRRDGRRARAALVAVSKETVQAEIREVAVAAPTVLPVHILAAVPKRDLFDDVVRKLSEIGAASLTPITTARSVVVPGEAKIARWLRIANEAMRQCGRSTALEIAPLRSAVMAFESAAADAKLVFDPRAERVRFAEACGPAKSIAIAVGPEGGFTCEELERAEASGFRGIGFGATVLRVETAAIVSAALAVDALTR